MNEQQIAKIEERWLNASGGPWIVENYVVPLHKRALIVETDQAMEEFRKQVLEGKLAKLRVEEVRNSDQAIASGLVRDREEWVRFLEEQQFVTDWSRIAMSCRLVIPCKRSQRDAEEREADRTVIGKPQRVSTTPPALAVLGPEQDGQCSDANLQFVLHAPEDVGVLISEVRRQTETIAALTRDLLVARDQAAEASARAASSAALVSRMKALARQVLEQLP